MPENKKKKKVSVDPGDLYQFMIAECRYGYTRNNHLMPSGAFYHVYEYLPLMAKADLDHAVHTATQLADEAIEELRRYAFNEYRLKAELCVHHAAPNKGATENIKAVWVPGANEFSVDKEFVIDGEMTLSTIEGLGLLTATQKEPDKFELVRSFPFGYNFRIMKPMPSRGEGWYESLMMPRDHAVVDRGAKLLLILSKDHQLNVTDYYKFIRYCLEFERSNGGRDPYNIDDFRKFLSEHPDGRDENGLPKE